MSPKQLWKNRAVPKLRLTLIGGPNSGKTTLLTALFANAVRERIPENAAEAFTRHLHDLNGDKTKPVPATTPEKGLPREIVFDVTFASKRMEVTTFDYAGEKALEFLQEEDSEFPSRLADSDAVVLLVDSHELSLAGSWKKWAERNNAEFFLGWIREVLSDRHHGHLPFAVVCTRSDLVPSDELDKLKDEIEEACVEAKLNNAKVRMLSVFGQHRATSEIPKSDGASLPPDFLVPREEISHCPTQFSELLIQLEKDHRKKFKSDHLRRVFTALLFMVLALVVLTAVHTELTEVDVQAVATEVRTGPDMLMPPHQNSLAKIFDEHDIREIEDRRILKNAWLDNIEQHLDEKLSLLNFRLEEGEWRPVETWSSVRKSLNVLRDNGRHAAVNDAVAELEQKLLEVEYSQGSTKELGELANAFANLGLNTPEVLISMLRENTAEKFERDLRSLIRHYRGGTETLYTKSIPELVRSVPSSSVSESFDERLRQLSNYCKLVSSANELKFEVYKFEHKENNKKIKIKVRFMAQHNGYTRIENVPQDSKFTEKFKRKIHFSERGLRGNLVTIPFSVGQTPISIEVIGGDDDVIVQWRSNDLNRELREKGYDLPGLSFFVLKDCEEYKTGHIPGWLWFEGPSTKLKLTIKAAGKLKRLLRPPQLLLDANRNR